MEREIRLEIDQLQDALGKAGIIHPDEFINSVHIEPGELVIKVEDESDELEAQTTYPEPLHTYEEVKNENQN